MDRSRCARADNAGFPEAIERPKRNGRPKAERDRSLELDQDLIGYDGLCRGGVSTIDGRVMAWGDPQLARNPRWIADHENFFPEGPKVLALGGEPIPRRF